MDMEPIILNVKINTRVIHMTLDGTGVYFDGIALPYDNIMGWNVLKSKDLFILYMMHENMIRPIKINTKYPDELQKIIYRITSALTV